MSKTASRSDSDTSDEDKLIVKFLYYWLKAYQEQRKKLH